VLPIQGDAADARKIWRVVLKSRVRKCRADAFECRSEAGGLITHVSMWTQNAAPIAVTESKLDSGSSVLDYFGILTNMMITRSNAAGQHREDEKWKSAPHVG
jgi:hypothetical protein